MDANFWHQKWKENNIAFHKSETNPLLPTYFNELSLSQSSRVFVPLCGKTRDIAWLLSGGHRVDGVELNKKAIEQLFTDLGLKPPISFGSELHRYSAKDIDIFVGDIFDLSATILGPVDAVRL